MSERKSISVLLEEAKARVAAMSPEEREAMWQAQRESWARGEKAMGETSVVARQPAPIASVKALEWDGRPRADVYSVNDSYGQGPEPFFLSRGNRVIGWFETVEAAKAFAQTDFETRIRAALAEPERQPGQPLQIEVIGGRLVISIGVGALAFAVQHADNQWPEDIYITDPYEFAKDVARQLRAEAEDGTTPVHVMLDRAAVEASAQGSEGTDYGDVAKGIEIARALMEKGAR
ncbi:MAG: hypothetical protein E5W57_04180 [Mesorhizobium sp.]|nr:MAG: hypothetical protein E5W57_04180 [Mesorhizobium sp.]